MALHDNDLVLPELYSAVVGVLSGHSFAEAAVALAAALADILIGVHQHPQNTPDAVDAVTAIFSYTLNNVLAVHGNGNGGEA